jgi:hypothetical protein
MTPKKRREWARVFLSARRQLGGLELILFSVACATDQRSLVPLLLAVRVVCRVAATQGRGWKVRPAWHLPPTWAPRALGALAVGIAVWGVLTLSQRWTPREMNVEVEDCEMPEWLLADQGDAGVVAKKMPSKRMKGQQASPCEEPLVLLNDACWSELVQRPPCGDFYEYEGRCYVPIVEKKRPPTSVGG